MAKTKKKGYITIDQEQCKGCYLCMSVCPNKLISICDKINHQGYYPVEFKENEDDGKKCVACSRCATICPDVAIEVYRE